MATRGIDKALCAPLEVAPVDVTLRYPPRLADHRREGRVGGVAVRVDHRDMEPVVGVSGDLYPVHAGGPAAGFGFVDRHHLIGRPAAPLPERRQLLDHANERTMEQPLLPRELHLCARRPAPRALT